MSKVLGKGDTGFGILIENDAGYISSDLNPKLLNESFEIKPDEPVLINCILQKWGVKNKNGRIYPKEILVPQVEEYQKLVDTNSAISESDHPDCVRASESEILTINGWKRFDEISENEKIQTLNIQTNEIEIQQINKKIFEDYDGEMFEFNSKNFHLTTTPNHRFLLEDRNGTRFYMTAEEIYDDVGGVLSSGKNKILKRGDWSGFNYDTYKLNGVPYTKLGKRIKKDLRTKYEKEIHIDGNDWFAFLGIFLSDGHTCFSNKGYAIGITQKKENTKNKIRELLNRLPFDFTEHSFNEKSQFHINDARLYFYLKKLGKSSEKYIPNDIKNASKEQLEILFNWFQLGDGRSVKTKDNKVKNSVFSTSKKLIDDLQEILIKIGKSGNITIQNNDTKDSWVKDKKRVVVNTDGTEEIIFEKRLIKKENRKPLYNLNISSTNYIWLDSRSIKINKCYINEKIACVNVPNSNFMVRVNGKSYWTGNSSVVSLDNVSHLIKKIWWGNGENENVLYGQLEIITSPAYMRDGIVCMVGDKIVEYLKRGIRLGISSRGVGSLKEVNGENVVQDDFELICFDLVASPSTPGAYLFPEKNEMSIASTMGETIEKKDVNINESTKKISTVLDNFLI